MLRDMIMKLTCIVTAFSIIGGPMAMYQAFAWSKMLHDRVPSQGLAEALDSTFSGAAPCEHCQKIAAIKSQQKEEPKKGTLPEKLEVLSVAKIIVSFQRISPTGPHHTRLGFINPAVHIPDSRTTQCPTPPPRAC